MLRGSFGVLQSDPKGVISEFGIAFWSQVYVYILSMVRGGVCVENISSFFCADHGSSMDRNWRGSSPQSFRARPAIKRYRPDTDAEDELPLVLHLASSAGSIHRPLGILVLHLIVLLVLVEVRTGNRYFIGCE